MKDTTQRGRSEFAVTWREHLANCEHCRSIIAERGVISVYAICDEAYAICDEAYQRDIEGYDDAG